MTDRKQDDEGENAANLMDADASTLMEDVSNQPNGTKNIDLASADLLSQPRIRMAVPDEELSGPPLHVQLNGRQIDFRTYRLEELIKIQQRMADGVDVNDNNDLGIDVDVELKEPPVHLSELRGLNEFPALKLQVATHGGDPLADVSDLALMLCQSYKNHGRHALFEDWQLAHGLLSSTAEAHVKNWPKDAVLAKAGITALWDQALNEGKRWKLELADRLLVDLIYQTCDYDLIVMAVNRLRADYEGFKRRQADEEKVREYRRDYRTQTSTLSHAVKIAVSRLVLLLADAAVTDVFGSMGRSEFFRPNLYQTGEFKKQILDNAERDLFDDLADATRKKLKDEKTDPITLLSENQLIDLGLYDYLSKDALEEIVRGNQPDADGDIDIDGGDTNGDVDLDVGVGVNNQDEAEARGAAVSDNETRTDTADSDNGQGTRTANPEILGPLPTHKAPKGKRKGRMSATDAQEPIPVKPKPAYTLPVSLPIDPRHYKTLDALLADQEKVANGSGPLHTLVKRSPIDALVKKRASTNETRQTGDGEDVPKNAHSANAPAFGADLEDMDITKPFRLPDGHEVLMVLPKMDIVANSSARQDIKQFEKLIGAWIPLIKKPDLAQVKHTLIAEFPHLVETINTILNTMAPHRSVRIQPTLLIGPPGSGKSTLARRLGEELGTYHVAGDIGGSSDSLLLGSSRKWGNGSPGVHFQAIMDAKAANPIVILDELEKAGTSHHNGNIQSAFLSLLEPSTASRTLDKYLEVPVNYGSINWIFTANNIDPIPLPLRNRLRILNCPEPQAEHMAVIANNLLSEEYQARGFDIRWASPLTAEELDAIETHRLSATVKIANANGKTSRKTAIICKKKSGSIRDLKRYVQRLVEVRLEAMRKM